MLGKGALSLGAMFVLWGVGITPVTAARSKASPATATVSLRDSPARVLAGHPVVLSGVVKGELTPATVRLYGRPFPYRKATLLGTTTAAAGGRFSFTERPGRNFRYRAYVVDSGAQALTRVAVRGGVKIQTRPIRLGRAKVVVVL